MTDTYSSHLKLECAITTIPQVRHSPFHVEHLFMSQLHVSSPSTVRQFVTCSRKCSSGRSRSMSRAQTAPAFLSPSTFPAPFHGGTCAAWRLPSPWLGVDLLWLLLRCGTSNVFPDVCDIDKLASSSLRALPALSNGRWHALVLDLRVDHG